MTAISMDGPFSSQANISKCWYANVSLIGSEQSVETFGLGFEPHSWIYY
jgi:hypothetical protein